jgi:SAM-dependent methyltransferase
MPEGTAAGLAEQGGEMRNPARSCCICLLRRDNNRMGRATDYRTASSIAAQQRVLDQCDSGRTVLGLGGGPFRIHPKIINLNIEPFENVDLVGDAHKLPLASASVDAVHCEAVFEHLRDPHDAAAELFRVMKAGAIGYVCTPFMQAFHGYPSHFQNFTHIGHQRLFERAGFTIHEWGTCVGPSYTVTGVVAAYLAHYPPSIMRWPLRAAWRVFSRVFVMPMDRWLADHRDAYVVASTTYVLIEKPAQSEAV